MENLKKVTTKKATIKKEVAKKELINLDNKLVEQSLLKAINKESIYIYSESQINKGQIKLDTFVNKSKGVDLTKKDKRKLKLSFHLSFAREEIRKEFQLKLIDFKKQISNVKDINKQKQIGFNIFNSFFESRFNQYKKEKLLSSELFCTASNSLHNQINDLCKILNHK